MKFKLNKDLKKIYNKPLELKVEEALNLLKDVEEKKGNNTPLIVNFSGGKDSLICLSLALKVTKNVVCCYANGGFELPGTIKYIKERCKEFNVDLHIANAGEIKLSHKPGSPLENCHTLKDFVLHYKYWPTSGRRWCSIWLKQRLMKQYWRQFYDNKTILYKLNGVRMFESPVRLWKYGKEKHYKRHIVDGNKFIRYDREHIPARLVYPILEFNDLNVLEYLKKENITIHEGYKLFGVSGCKYCPVHKAEVYKKILNVYPNLYNDIIELENKIKKPAVENKYYLADLKKEVLEKKGGA